MKTNIIFTTFLCFLISLSGNSQHIKYRKKFPVNITIIAPGPAPFAGAIWIAPEWQWQNGDYIYIPGYWTKPKKHHRRWISGFWKRTRRGFVWISGYWK